MSIAIKLYSFSKYENSTKVPSGSAGTTYNGVLIEPCSVLNPVIKVNGINGYSYNYAYISTFSRYYFITDWETQDGFWYLTLRVDPMGSFKTTIGSSTQFVLRAAGAQDTYLVDTLYPTSGEMTTSTAVVTEGLQSYLEDGIFVLNITGSADATVGTYACLWSTFKNVIKKMLLMNSDDTFWSNLADGIRESIFHPFEHLGTVIWFPPDYIDLEGITPTNSITLGSINLTSSSAAPMEFYYLTTPSIWQSNSITLPKHPQASTYGKYMNLKPYSQYIYSDGVFGNIELDPLKMVDTTTFRIWKLTDPATGIQIVELPDGSSRTGQVGVMISMENNSLNLGGVVQGLASAALGIATGGASTAVQAISAAGGVASAALSLQPSVSSTSQYGSTANVWQPIAVLAYFWKSSGHDDVNMGKPYCKTKQINTLSGYILTDNSHISSTIMTSSEQDMITSIMDSGFYYE